MSDNQKVTNEQIQNYLKDNVSDLSLEEKYLFFQKLEIPINYAIAKVLRKFHTIPLEKEDFTSIAWLAFDEVLRKYQPTLTHKSFITYVIDNVYWKAMDYACKFVNNKHKILNLNNVNLSWQENQNLNVADSQEWMTQIFLEDYFRQAKIPTQNKDIFMDYLYNVPLVDIREKYQISRHKLKQTLEKTIADLERIIT
ncbi:hypothetical protein JN01_0080 [Entomoplasma freundtii]|uniref:Uncharacterized protein n=1 Tax=Entomoplasma freundtii TaxID=74700 RepID=A0A2K8NU48_9MOLU|nr:sigma-70 family RNA polymerase sigma factor [Entomoplasma freundtii]ATZ16698.1 hypothetical protein EFREU_v1c06780 [Entomoplasma freundtii]TDY58135.1 hypothetical protein JN01_0080 [Entomoplasma freundtii]